MDLATSQELEIEVRKQTRLKDAAILKDAAKYQPCICLPVGSATHTELCPRAIMASGARMLELMAEE